MIDLYWLPLGAGGRVVRCSGRAFERLAARRAGRQVLDLYHSALVVQDERSAVTIEMGPVRGQGPGPRGVVVHGPVGAAWAGCSSLFRYEVRRWADGEIADLEWAVESPWRVPGRSNSAQRLLDLVPFVPALTWGRDELGTGDMWNSNSVVSWLLEGTGHDADRIAPPSGGRAPGWDAGWKVARRDQAPGSSLAARGKHPSRPGSPQVGD